MSAEPLNTPSRVPANRRCAEAMQALETGGSPHVVPSREYVRSLRTEARKYRVRARTVEGRAQRGN